MCRIGRPFARTLNGQTPPRYSPLDSGSPRNNLGLARSPFVLRTFPPRAGATGRLSGGGRPPSGLLSLAEPAYAPRPSPAATTVLITGFWQRFARPFRRLSRLVAGTAGGPCVGDPVWSRSLPVYLYSVVFVQRLRKVELDLSRRGDSSFSVRRSECTRIGACCLYYYICCGSQVSEPGITGI